MPFLATASGRLEYLVTGAGEPVTVFAHGLTATIAETRPLASGVLGTRVFLSFRGHGRSDLVPGTFDYAGLDDDLSAVADHVGATRALGVSIGAAALLHLLARSPDRFERLVFFLPAVLDQPRTDPATQRVAEMGRCLATGDVGTLAAFLVAELPDGVRDLPAAVEYTRQRAAMLIDSPLADVLVSLRPGAPIENRAALGRVTAPALVVGQQGDEVHPAGIAEELAAALPNARLHVFSEAGALWLTRRRLRELVAGFLNG